MSSARDGALRLVRCVREALQPKLLALSVDLDGMGPAPLDTGDAAALDLALLERAEDLLQHDRVVNLEIQRDELAAEDIAHMERAEVTTLADLTASEGRRGVLFLGDRKNGQPYSGADLEFIANVCTSAAGALQNARLAAQIASNSRQAATGRAAIALAHDLGKEMDWLARVVTSLPENAEDPERLARDAHRVCDLADSVVERVRSFVREASAPSPRIARESGAAADGLLRSAVRRVALLHGRRTIATELDPRTARLHLPGEFERAVASLLDNALLASPEPGTVRLEAHLKTERLEVVVEDRGRGIPAHLVGRVFEPGFTTRRAQGGLGVGLGIARDILHAMGGVLEVHSTPGRGTRVHVLVPTAER